MCAMNYTETFGYKEQALAEQERLQKSYCTWIEYENNKGWRVKYCPPAEYLETLTRGG